MGDDEEMEPDATAAGLALLSEQLEELKKMQEKANELAHSQVELTVKTNELLKEIKAGIFFTPPTLKGPPTIAPPAEAPPAPTTAPTRRKPSLSETAEKLKEKAEAKEEAAQ